MIKENIMDKKYLNKCFLAFKQDLIKNKDLDWHAIYLNGKEKLILTSLQE